MGVFASLLLKAKQIRRRNIGPEEADPPVISLPSGTYTSIQTITLSDDTPGATIYYSASGTAGYVPYTGPITISVQNQTISAYAQAMNLTCALTSSPAGAQSLPTCSLSPATLAIASGGTGTTSLSVKTTAASNNAMVQPLRQGGWELGGGTVLAVVLMLGVPRARRRRLLIVALVAISVAGWMTGCGGGGNGGGGTTGPSTPATTAGNYVFTVTGTDSADTEIATSAKVNITVQ